MLLPHYKMNYVFHIPEGKLPHIAKGQIHLIIPITNKTLSVNLSFPLRGMLLCSGVLYKIIISFF